MVLPQRDQEEAPSMHGGAARPSEAAQNASTLHGDRTCSSAFPCRACQTKDSDLREYWPCTVQAMLPPKGFAPNRSAKEAVPGVSAAQDGCPRDGRLGGMLLENTGHLGSPASPFPRRQSRDFLRIHTVALGYIPAK